MIEESGGHYLIFRVGECCVSSGAVYAFLPKELGKVLTENKDVLALAGIPCESTGFIRAIAGTWFDNEATIIPLLKKVFGDV